jgi:hypothetical protein
LLLLRLETAIPRKRHHRLLINEVELVDLDELLQDQLNELQCLLVNRKTCLLIEKDLQQRIEDLLHVNLIVQEVQ